MRIESKKFNCLYFSSNRPHIHLVAMTPFFFLFLFFILPSPASKHTTLTLIFLIINTPKTLQSKYEIPASMEFLNPQNYKSEHLECQRGLWNYEITKGEELSKLPCILTSAHCNAHPSFEDSTHKQQQNLLLSYFLFFFWSLSSFFYYFIFIYLFHYFHFGVFIRQNS